jgi:hypothetical protein
VQDLLQAARTKGMQLNILKAGTESEIETPSSPSLSYMSVRSSSAPIRSSTAGATSSWRWQHAMPFRRSIRCVNSPWLAA